MKPKEHILVASMQCAEVVDAYQPLKITKRPVPEAPDEGLLIKTVCAGVCHTDLHYIDDEINMGDGKVQRRRDLLGDKYKGAILGHEIAGIVLARGIKVPKHCRLKEGDRVLVYPWKGCGNCEMCAGKESQICENSEFGTLDIGLGDHPGGYASHLPLEDWELAIKVPKNIPMEIACMLPCSALSAYEAIVKTRPAIERAVRLRGVANLLLIGIGGLGMWCIVIIKSVFCDKNVNVICADLHSEKLAYATELGADDVVEWKPEATTEDLVSMTTVSGYNKIDAAIDLVAKPQTLEIAFQSLHNGGTIVPVGFYGGEIQIPVPLLVGKNISVQGSRAGSVSHLRELVDLLSVQDIENYPKTELVKLCDINDVHQRMREGKPAGRVIIKYDINDNVDEVDGNLVS